MFVKFVTGLAVSVGAGLALQVSARNSRRGGQATKVTPVTIRVHQAALRPELRRGAYSASQPVEEHTVHVEAVPPALAVHAVETPLPAAPDRSSKLAELRSMIENMDKRTGEMMSSINQRIDGLQHDVPRFIDIKVSSRLREVEDRLRAEFQDVQSNTLDVFLKTLDSKVLPRLSNVEEAVGLHADEICHMRNSMDRTDEAIARLVARVDKVVASMTVPTFPGYASPRVYPIDRKAVA